MIRKIFNVLLMPFKYLYRLIKIIVVSIVKGFYTVFKLLYKSVYNFIKYGIYGIRWIFIALFKVIFSTIKYISYGIKYIVLLLFGFIRYVFYGIKWVLITLYKGLFLLLKNIYLFLKKFFIYVYLGIRWIFITLFSGVFLILKKIYLFFKKFFIYMYLGLKWVGLKVYKLILDFFIYFYKGLKYVGKSILKLFVYMITNFFEGLFAIYDGLRNIFKKLYKIFLYYPSKWYRNMQEKAKVKREENRRRREELIRRKQQIIIERKAKEEKLRREKEDAKAQRNKNRDEIKKAQAESRVKARAERKTIKEIILNWYNSLSFVKDRKNRKELKRQTLLLDFEGADAVRSEEKVLYKYVAKNNETGKVEKGIFAAFSKLDVHSYLLAEGYEVYEITPQKRLGKNSKGGAFIVTRIKKSDLVFFLTQLSTFLKSGVTLVDSVKIMAKQTKKATYKQLYKAIIYELTMGENFSEALAKQGDSFPRLLINMIKTSELTGNLPETLDDMAEYYQEMEKTRKQMVSAMTYPVVIFLFAVVILSFIMIYVIPQFVDIYSGLDTGLPGITVVVINTSHFLQTNFLYLLIGVVAFIIGFRVLYKSIKVFKTLVQWIMMHVPIIGKIIIYNEVTMFTKTFGSLLNHNVFITDSMEVLSKITNNEVYKMLIFDTITNLAKGEAISNSFKNHWAFPVVAYEMLLTGEKTGQLGDMMNKVSTYYQEQHRNAVNQIKVFIEPVMIVFLAFVVGTILLSVILPMFSMYTAIQ